MNNTRFLNGRVSDLKELKEAQWEVLVKFLLKDAEKTEEAIKSSQKGAPWKVRIAKQIRTQTTAGNGCNSNYGEFINLLCFGL